MKLLDDYHVNDVLTIIPSMNATAWKLDADYRGLCNLGRTMKIFTHGLFIMCGPAFDWLPDIRCTLLRLNYISSGKYIRGTAKCILCQQKSDIYRIVTVQPWAGGQHDMCTICHDVMMAMQVIETSTARICMYGVGISVIYNDEPNNAYNFHKRIIAPCWYPSLARELHPITGAACTICHYEHTELKYDTCETCMKTQKTAFVHYHAHVYMFMHEYAMMLGCMDLGRLIAMMYLSIDE